MITGEDGKFEFSGLPAGKYSLEGAKRGFISAAYDQHDQFSTAIVTGAGLDTETLMLRLAPDAVIAGKVLDEFGDPVRAARLTLYYNDHSTGLDRIRQSRSGRTDDQGAYELTPLRPGTYFLSVTAQPWYAIHPNSDLKNPEADGQGASTATFDRSLDVAYPVTFYPDVTDTQSAMPIPIRGGEHLQADIHLTPVPALHLKFSVPENGTVGFSFPLLQQPAFDGTTPLQINEVRRVAHGMVEVAGIPAGHYDVRLAGPAGPLEMAAVDLYKDGQEIDASSAVPMSSVKISVHATGGAPVSGRLTVGLRSGRRVPSALQPVDSKGEAELKPIAPGSYELFVQSSEMPYSIVSCVAEGGEVSGHTLTIAAGSSPSVSLTVVAGSVEVQGKATKGENGFAGAMIVLVPENPETNHASFRRDQSDLDGTFSLRGVVPGSYTLLAIENGWDLDWSQPGALTAYLKRGRKVQVGSKAGHSVNVAEAIEVQSR
jgi:hypothetical protein